MRRSGEYRGHHCWNCWNVSLWIGNDEGLYLLALDCLRRPHKRTGKRVSRHHAAVRFMEANMQTRTPDGGRYTARAVYNALEGLE